MASPAVTRTAEGSTEKPNLLFVFSDQQRRQALSFMGQDPVHTPHTDAFAKQSLVLHNAMATSPLCTPFRGSLVTGRYPTSTGVTTNERHLNVNEVGIGKSLQRAGYHTGWIGKWHLYSPEGYGRGKAYVPPEERHGFEFWHACNANHDIFWREYYEDSPTPVVNEFGWQIPHETNVAIDFIKNRRDKNRPFALFVSTIPPHNGEVMKRSQMPLRHAAEGERPMLNDFSKNLVYHAPDEWEERYRNWSDMPRRGNVKDNYARHHCTGYFAGCDAMDHEFGRLLQSIKDEGLMENTIIVYSSDHGEMMGSHDLMSKNAPFEESIGIPFIIHWEGKIQPGNSNTLFTQTDIAPTLLSLMGVRTPVAMEGHDCSGLFLGKASRGRESALLHYYSKPHEVPEFGLYGKGWRGIRTDQYAFIDCNDYHKYFIGNQEQAVYDLVMDPLQLNPIHLGQSRQTDVLIRELKSQLKDYLWQVGDPWEKRLV